MRNIIWAAAAIVGLTGAPAARAEINLTPCDIELTAEVQRIEGAIAMARAEWQNAVATRIAASGMSGEQMRTFEKSYAEDATALFSAMSKNLEVVAKVRMPLVLPAYNPVICERLEPLRRVNDEIVVSYRELLTGLLEVLDQSIAKARQ